MRITIGPAKERKILERDSIDFAPLTHAIYEELSNRMSSDDRYLNLKYIATARLTYYFHN